MDYEARIRNSIDYIEKNLCNEITLNDIAKQSYFSEFYFHKLFHNIVGLSVMEYVRKRRLSEAAVDLLRTDEMITDIAFKYQFSSEESFSRAFKRMYGMSPRRYRNSKFETDYSKNVCVSSKYSKSYSRRGTALFMAA